MQMSVRSQDPTLIGTTRPLRLARTIILLQCFAHPLHIIVARQTKLPSF